MRHSPTTAELRAAYDRAPLLRLAGYSFARALATPLVRKSLEGSAAARARRSGPPAQPVLI